MRWCCDGVAVGALLYFHFCSGSRVKYCHRTTLLLPFSVRCALYVPVWLSYFVCQQFHTAFSFDLKQWQSYIQHHNSSNNDNSRRKKEEEDEEVEHNYMPLGFGAPILHSETSRILWLTLISLFFSLSLTHFHLSLNVDFPLLSSHQLYWWSPLKYSELLCRKRTSTLTMLLSRSFCFLRDVNFLASIKCREEARIGYTDARNSSFCIFFHLIFLIISFDFIYFLNIMCYAVLCGVHCILLCPIPVLVAFVAPFTSNRYVVIVLCIPLPTLSNGKY